MSKQEAERLAEHIRIDQDWCEEASALLRQWPDGEPVAYQYLFEGTYGPVWRNDDGLWNGQKPTASRPLYAAPPDQSARIAELERQRDALLDALQGLMDPATNEDGEWYRETRAKARAAIKAAGGGK